jgi:hypothetical protein
MDYLEKDKERKRESQEWQSTAMDSNKRQLTTEVQPVARRKLTMTWNTE